MKVNNSGGRPIRSFVGIRAKCYSMLQEGVEQKLKKAAGVKRSVQLQSLQHRHYLEILNENSIKLVEQKTFISKKQKIYTQRQTKIGLSAFDLKRYICKGGILTLPYGHYKIKRLQK